MELLTKLTALFLRKHIDAEIFPGPETEKFFLNVNSGYVPHFHLISEEDTRESFSDHHYSCRLPYLPFVDSPKQQLL